MALTPLAESIAPVVLAALATLERDVFERRPFVPADLTRTFKIRTTDYLEAVVVPSVLATLAGQAPHARLASMPVGPALPKAELESGACDLAIAGFFEDVPPGFQRQTLFEDTFACAVRKGHGLVRGRRAGLEAFCAARHIVVAPGGELTGGVDRALARRKLARRVVAGTSAFLVAAWICARTDHVLTAPLRLLEPLARPLGLETFEPPVAMPGIRIAQIWHARSDADPAHRWFRAVLRDAAGGGAGKKRA
jgi:DNA-binding transcriptional LysR family regulator